MMKSTFLGGIRYQVLVQDTQVIFRQSMLKLEIVIDRPLMEESPGAYRVASFSSEKGIPLVCFEDARKYLNKNFGGDFEPYKGELGNLNKKLIKLPGLARKT